MTNNTWGCSIIHTHVCVPLHACNLSTPHTRTNTHIVYKCIGLYGKPHGCRTSWELPVTLHCSVKQSILQWNGFQVYGQDPCVSQSVERKHMEISICNKVLTFGDDLFLIMLIEWRITGSNHSTTEPPPQKRVIILTVTRGWLAFTNALRMETERNSLKLVIKNLFFITRIVIPRFLHLLEGVDLANLHIDGWCYEEIKKAKLDGSK